MTETAATTAPTTNPSMCDSCRMARDRCPIFSPRKHVDACVEYRPNHPDTGKAWELRLAASAMRTDPDAARFWAALCHLTLRAVRER